MLTMAFTGLESLKESESYFTNVTTGFHGPAPVGVDGSAAALTFGPDDKGAAAALAEAEDSAASGGKSAHASAMITGLDACARKPLIVTCGIDRSVRVWNYMTHRSEVVKFFPEDCYSVAFHPSGLHILVGFSDKLRFMNLLMDDIRVVAEFPIKGCRECRFSAGGQMFAAANGHSIQLYRTYTAEPVALLRGHNGKVHSLHW